MMEQPTDTERLDWFTSGKGRNLFQTMGGEWCAQDDDWENWFGDTPRSAIDAAIAAAKADSTF